MSFLLPLLCTSSVFFIFKSIFNFMFIDSFYVRFFFMFCYISTLLLFHVFSDLLVSDFPSLLYRSLIVYNCISIMFNTRNLIKVFLSSDNTTNSIVDIYTCVSWYEREAWDLYGVFFSKNLDLRRILNDYGFFGHPFKKDFPLSGFSELMYVFRLSSLRTLKILFLQEFRFFSRVMPWKNNTFF